MVVRELRLEKIVNYEIMEKHIKPLLEENGNSQLLGVLVAVFAIIITLGNIY